MNDQIHLSCGHCVDSMDDGVILDLKDYDKEGNECVLHGIYCKKCAAYYKKNCGGIEVK